MTDRELMQMALEELEKEEHGYVSYQKIIGLLRDRLAQPEPEAVAWMWKDGTLTSDPDFADGTWKPLFTAPSKREWQKLTVAEFEELENMFSKQVPNEFLLADIICTVSSMLREKNT